MLGIAAVGLVANPATARLLHDHGNDLNARGAFLHVLGDALSSIGVIAGGVIMLVTRWYVVDPIISALIGLFLLAGSWRVLRSSLHILLEGTPEGVCRGRSPVGESRLKNAGVRTSLLRRHRGPCTRNPPQRWG
jgi:cobalt-zinc-cadmium efflux system protein